MGLKCKLRQSTDKLVAPLVKALVTGIDVCFESVLSDKEHLVAWCIRSSVQFKLHFLQEDARLDVKRMVLAYVKQVQEESHDTVDCGGKPATAAVPDEDENDLYSFMHFSEQIAIGRP